VLNTRTLFGLPRKFNVAFDGGGQIAALEDTNDIGFSAVEAVEGGGVDPGIWFRLLLGGITGHKDFARPTGVYLKPEESTEIADAIVRIFIDHGDRTNRDKARLKYVLDAWGFEKFVAEIEARIGRPLARIPEDCVKDRPRPNRMAHIGVHRQKQPGESWIGVVLKSGRLSAEQMEGIARVSRDYGDGDIRLTVWQNLILSGVTDEKLESALSAIDALGLATTATPLRAGLVSCTGNKGCKFAASDTKGTAEAIAAHVEAKVALDTPLNIHLTGCHHSCAQHYIGDIGMIACKVAKGEDAEPAEGFHIFVGGGSGPDARLARELWTDVEIERCPAAIEKLLSVYLANRTGPGETFLEFSARHEIAALRQLAGETAP
jgi:ferredoxin-nitrite reductase